MIRRCPNGHAVGKKWKNAGTVCTDADCGKPRAPGSRWNKDTPQPEVPANHSPPKLFQPPKSERLLADVDGEIPFRGLAEAIDFAEPVEAAEGSEAADESGEDEEPGEERKSGAGLYRLEQTKRGGPSKAAPEALKAAHQMFLERMRTARVPAALAGDKAVEWSQAKLVTLLPEAVAELQFQLRYGNDKLRSSAVETILRANGVAQKDAATGSTPTIILSLGDNMGGVPFLERMQASKKKP